MPRGPSTPLYPTPVGKPPKPGMVWDPYTGQWKGAGASAAAKPVGYGAETGRTGPAAGGGGSGGGHPSPWTPFNVNEKQFTTGAYPAIGEVVDKGTSVSTRAGRQIDPLTGQILEMTNQPAPTMTGPGERPNTPTVSMPGRFDAAAGLPYDPYNNSLTDARGKQGDIYDAYGNIVSGGGPSIAEGMVKQNAQTAATDIAGVTQDANDRYGAVSRAAGNAYDDASTRAAFDYANASEEQRFAFEQAAKSASASTKQAAEDAIRSSASLITRAGPGQLGSALLNAQGQAAFAMTDAQRRAAQIDETARLAAGQMASSAQRASAFNAAGTQRQVAAGEQTENATTASNAARGVIAAENVRAQGDLAAGQVRSGEIMGALGAQAGLAGNIRAGDQGDVNAALGIQSGALQADTLSSNIAQGNADRDARLMEAWTQMDQRAKETNVGSTLTASGQAYNALQGVMSTQAGREAMGLAIQGNFAGLAAQMGMSAQQLNAQVYQNAQALGVAWQTASDQQKMQLIGSVISAAATIGGVVVGAAVGGPVGAAVGGTVGGTVAGAAKGR